MLNENDKRVHNVMKDGKPQKTWQKIVALGYLWVCITTIIFSAIMYFKKLKKVWNWETFIYAFLFSMPMTFLWGQWALYSDPNYGGWEGLPFHTIGKIFSNLMKYIGIGKGIPIEDLLFFTGAGFLTFYTIVRSFQLFSKTGTGIFKSFGV